MLTEEELDERVTLVKGQIENIGDEIIGETSGTHEIDGDEFSYKGILSEEQSYGCKYQVVGSTRHESMSVRYDFDLRATIANSVEYRGVLEGLEDENPKEAAQPIINRVDDRDLDRLTWQLHDKISNPKVMSEITHDDELISGFIIRRLIFPWEDNYALSDFYDTLTAVTSMGEIGARYLSNAFAIEIDEESKQDVQITFDPDEVFRKDLD